MTAGRGGIARVARLMARSLSDLARDGEIEASVCSLDDTRPPSDLDVPVSVCAGSRARFVAYSHRRCLDHTHFLYDHLGMARAHCRIPGLRRPFLAYLHGVEIWEKARRDRLLVARRADALVSNSRYTLRRARSLHGGLERASVCWLATEQDEPPPARGAGETAPRVLMVSRVAEAYKGHALLVGCWPRVVAAVPEAVLTFVGRGPGFDALRDQAARSPAAESIELAGFLSEAELQESYAGSSLLVLPSRGEGFGLVTVEAMRHALPVVATVHDASPEVNVEGETGFNVDLDSPSELPRRLIELLRRPEQAAAMGRRGRKRWSELFRYGAFKARFESLLEEFLAGRFPDRRDP